MRKNGKEYLELQTPEVGFNYWELKAQVVEGPTVVRDGHRFSVHILTPTRAYREVVRCFTVAGSPADRAASSLRPGQEPVLAAIGRFDLRTLLASNRYEGPIPVELCVFGINPQQLPAVGRGGGSNRVASTGGSSRRRAAGRYSGEGGGGPYQSPAGLAESGQYGGGEGQVIGNKRSHVYHVGNDSHLPAPQNRVYFRTAAEAEAAGYRAAGT